MQSTIQAARENIRSLLLQCNAPYEVAPLDEDLFQECIDDAIQRGYPVDGDPPFRAYLRQGIFYGANASAHLSHRPTQIWITQWMSCAIFVDDVTDRWPEEMTNVYLFNDRFVNKEPQGHPILVAFDDIIRRAPDFYRPVASHLVITSTLNFVTANLIERETKSMKILSAAREYPTYQRILSGFAEACGFILFPREIPLNEYIQAIPDIRDFIDNVNDVMSFYKEELVGETMNLISMLATRANKSRLEMFDELTETTINLYKGIVKILEGSPKACEAFKRYAIGYIHFHTSLARYRLKELDL